MTSFHHPGESFIPDFIDVISLVLGITLELERGYTMLGLQSSRSLSLSSYHTY